MVPLSYRGDHGSNITGFVVVVVLASFCKAFEGREILHAIARVFILHKYANFK